jgi:capsular exopolysaccharide synthesis family protein
MTQLVTLTAPRSPAAEAIRTLRTNLMYRSVEKPIQTLMITAPQQPSDKSETAANLAVAFAQAGNHTILVDADLRRPTQHTIWGIADNARGLTTMMIEDAALATPPLQPAPGVDNLDLLLSGTPPPSPADLLASERMSEIIGLLKARADYIVFDAPPVLVATDAAALGNKLDGVLLVIRAGETRREHALRARQALERVNVNILGATLTNAPKQRGQRYE